MSRPCRTVSISRRWPHPAARPTIKPPMTETFFTSDLLAGHGDAQQKLAFVVERMRDLSRQTDPQVMVAEYGKRMRQVVPSDAYFSLSRRDLESPTYRITRSSRWEEPLNPWKHKARLPILSGGIISRI